MCGGWDQDTGLGHPMLKSAGSSSIALSADSFAEDWFTMGEDVTGVGGGRFSRANSNHLKPNLHSFFSSCDPGTCYLGCVLGYAILSPAEITPGNGTHSVLCFTENFHIRFVTPGSSRS